MLFSLIRISYNQNSRILLWLVLFIKPTLGTVTLITFAPLIQDISSHAILSLLYVFRPSLVIIVFLRVALWSFNKLHDHMTYKNMKKRVIIQHVTYSNGIILFAYVFQPSFVLYLCKNCDITFLNYHVITPSIATWFFPSNLF